MPASNYPDDIRSYDNTPGSPFYEEPMRDCIECCQLHEAEELDEEGYCIKCKPDECEVCGDTINICGGCEDE